MTGPEPPAAGAGAGTDGARRRPSSRRGRQAEARRNDAAVLEAARTVFARRPDAPVAAVAAQAGVGVGTLYRRYGGKDELLASLCVEAMEQTIEIARSALGRDDPWDGLEHYVRGAVALRTGSLAALAGRVPLTDEMRRTGARGGRLVARVIARAHRDGSLRADATSVDVAWLIEWLGRRAPDAVDPASEDRVRDRLLALALEGLHAPAGAPLPGPRPSWAAYARRWER